MTETVEQEYLPGMVAIYVLRDPDTQEPRYVGKAARPKKRLIQHCTPSGRRGRTHRHHWLASLHALGKKPALEIVDWVKASKWKSAERHYILEYKRLGARLTNGDEGGYGGLTGPETRSRYLKRMLSKTYTDFLRMQPDSARRLAAKMRWLYAMRPDFMPKTWKTIGLSP